MNNYWNKKALKRKGIKGEHAYLEAIEDVKKEFDKEIKRLEKEKEKFFITTPYTYYIKSINDFKLKLFN